MKKLHERNHWGLDCVGFLFIFIKHFPRKKTFLPLNAFHRNPLKNMQPSLRNRNMSRRKESNYAHRINQILFSLSLARQRDAQNGCKQKWCVWTSTETLHFDSALPDRLSPRINHHRQWRQADSKHLIIWPSTLSWLMLEAESPQRKEEHPFAHKLTSTVYPF